MRITSPAFQNNDLLPVAYSCDGAGVNPPLEFLEIPENAKSLALIVEDPDAPNGTFTHWVVYNIPVTTTLVAENSVPKSCVEGKTSLGKPGFVGACPPHGQHRYIFTLFALDTLIQDKDLDKTGLENAMKDHVLAHAALTATYKRP